MKIYYKDQNMKLKAEIASLKAQLKSASNNEDGNADKFARSWNGKFSKSDRVYSDFSSRHQYRKQKEFMEVCGFNGTSKSEQNNEIVNLTVDLIERGGK